MPDPVPESSDPGPDPVEDSAEPRVRRRRYPSTIGGFLYLGVLAAAVAAFVVLSVGDWRVGVRVLAGALVVAGALRLGLRADDAGMLAVRRRTFDVLLLVAVGATLWWLAGSIPDQPGTLG